MSDVVWLFAAGVVAGVVSVVASLASLVSYPALLAVGVPPLAANVTNTTALVFVGFGSAAGSRPELAGQRPRLLRLGLLNAVGGGIGAALLLLTPASAFEAVVPWLIAAASLVLLAGPGLRPDQPGGREGSTVLNAAVLAVAVYTGYFGAAGGVLVLAVLTALLDEPLVRTIALKNVVSSVANAVAAVIFALFGPVDWSAVPPLALGFLVGGRLGPALVRRLPGDALRVFIALCGLGVAVKLGIDTYG
ncbi:MAG: sulfite exporter TauE/SafE family protein [Mycobacteriales bacterium]